MEVVRKLNAWAVAGVAPDGTFYLRLGTEERERRARKAGDLDRIEVAGTGFMDLVTAGFEELARAEPDRIEVLDASLLPEQLAETVRRRMLEMGSGGRKLREQSC